MTTQDLNADVLVIGAGASGIPAAIGAARTGARVLLIEEDPVVGGAISDYYVDMLCGGPITGVTQEAHEMLKAQYAIAPGQHSFFLPSSYLRVLTTLLEQEPNVRVMVGARVVAAVCEQSNGRPRVTGVQIERSLGETTTIHGAVTIDATGSGAVAVLAGCRAMYGREARSDFNEALAPDQPDEQVQLCTWMYFSQQLGGGVPLDMMQLDNVKLGVLVNGFGWFHRDPQAALRVTPRIYLHWGCAVPCQDTRDPVALAAAQMEAMRAMERDHALLREHNYAIYLAPRLGVRESRRVVGETVITENDLRSGVLPADAIAIGSYGIDNWGGDVAMERRETPTYGIPYRALVPANVDGLLIAGKAISGTHVASSAYRVMPIVGSIGQSAGIAAALCARHGNQPRELDPLAHADFPRWPR